MIPTLGRHRRHLRQWADARPAVTRADAVRPGLDRRSTNTFLYWLIPHFCAAALIAAVRFVPVDSLIRWSPAVAALMLDVAVLCIVLALVACGAVGLTTVWWISRREAARILKEQIVLRRLATFHKADRTEPPHRLAA